MKGCPPPINLSAALEITIPEHFGAASATLILLSSLSPQVSVLVQSLFEPRLTLDFIQVGLRLPVSSARMFFESPFR
jgi:hypothetical protein